MSKDIRKDLYAMVVLPGGVAMFQGIGEYRAKECNVSFDRVFVPVTGIVVVSLGAKSAQAEEECWIAHRLDTVTLQHICFPCHRAVVCTRSLFQRIRVGSRLPQNRVAFVMVAEGG